MIFATDEVARSLAGAWDLFNRRAQGLARFDFSEGQFWRSFAAPLLAAPALIVWLAAERAEAGVLSPGSLFDEPSLVARAATHLTILWLTLPLLGIAIARHADLRRRFVPFIVVCNWSFVLAAAFLTLPALMSAIGWATPALATLYSIAAIVLIVQMRWFSAKITLGLGSGAALLLAFGDGLIGMGLLRTLI